MRVELVYPTLLKHLSHGVSLWLAEQCTEKTAYKYCRETTLFKPEVSHNEHIPPIPRTS